MGRSAQRIPVCSATAAVSEVLVGVSYSKCLLVDGTYGKLVMMNVYVDDSPTYSSSCTLVDGSGGTNAWCELGNMSSSDASVVGVAVGLVWAIAWGFKVLRKSINLNEESS